MKKGHLPVSLILTGKSIRLSDACSLPHQLKRMEIQIKFSSRALFNAWTRL
jgi:hypothetical protein